MLWRKLGGLVLPSLAPFCSACDHADGQARARAVTAYAVPRVLDAGTSPPFPEAPSVSETPLLGSFCPDENADMTGAVGALLGITDAYVATQRERCGRMTGGMSPAELDRWVTYLYEYTGVMAGCLDVVRAPPGGILAFGPANTAAIGVSRPPLSQEDARLLGEAYAAPFAAELGLTPAERERLEQHLGRSAAPEIDPQLESLSLCASGSDAG